MGNSAGKQSDENLREAVQMVLRVPMIGPAAAAAAAAGAGSSDAGGDGSVEQARAVEEAKEEAVAVAEELEEEVWMGFFGCAMGEEEFFEAFSASDATAMSVLQPGNLKLIAREALSNISRFMEARQTSPPMATVQASVRVLTRVFPALLADPALRAWCWARRPLPRVLSYLEQPEEEDPPDRNNRGSRGEQREQQPIARRGRFPPLESDDESGEGGGRRKPTPTNAAAGDGGRARSRALSGSDGGEGEEKGSSGDDADGDDGSGDGGDGDLGGGDDDDDDFSVCFASVALHVAINLLCFPGFCVDGECSDWDDYYTPIPELHYGIREASIIWAPGIAVTENNMKQVNSLNSNRVEALRLLAALLSLPLFLETPTVLMPRPSPPPSSTAVPGLPLSNPIAALATSRHLNFSPELFYSLINLAVVGRARGGVSGGGAEGKGWIEWLGLGGGGGGGTRAGPEGGPQSLTEWSLQMLALLLRHGRPYGELLKERGVDLAATGTLPVFGAIPRTVELSAEKAKGYNCFRRCVFVLHSDDDLGSIALGLLRHMDDVRLGKTRPHGSALSIHQEALMIFSSFVHENPLFVPRLAASEELTRGTAVCVCHFLETAVSSTIEYAEQRLRQEDVQQQQKRQQRQQEQHEDQGRAGAAKASAAEQRDGGGRPGSEENVRRHHMGEEIGQLVLLGRVLLALSENESFMAALAEMPAVSRTRRGAGFSAPALEDVPGTTMLEVVLSLSAWSLARAGRGATVAAPALAAVARNACPFAKSGMMKETAEWLLDALEMYLAEGGDDDNAQRARGSSDGAEGTRGGGVSSSWAVASLLLEGLAAAAVSNHEQQRDLMMAMVDRSRENDAINSHGNHELRYDARAPRVDGGDGGGGVFRWLAARGGMLEGGDSGGSGNGKGNGQSDTGGFRFGGGNWRGRTPATALVDEAGNAQSTLASEHYWFEASVATVPWEGWAMRQVLWPLLSLLVAPLPGAEAEAGAAAASMCAGESQEEVRAKAVHEFAAFARKNMLRPSGLCPPWDEDAHDETAAGCDDSAGQYPDRHREGSTATATAVAAAGAHDQEATSRGAGPSLASPGRAAAVTDVSLIEEGGGVPSPTHRFGSEDNGIVGANLRGDWKWEGGGGALTRVVTVEEPWQSIYLWSLLFVKTTSDLRLFDSRAVRLFDVVEETEDDGSRGPTDSGANSHLDYDEDPGTEVDEDYYQESFFPAGGDVSSAESEQQGRGRLGVGDRVEAGTGGSQGEGGGDSLV